MLPTEPKEVKEYWKAPILDLKEGEAWQVMGDRGRDPLFHAIGRTLTIWETLETYLAATFILLRDGGSVEAAKAFGEFKTAPRRADEIEHAIEVYIERNLDGLSADERVVRLPELEEHRTTLKIFLTNYVAAVARRNEVVHGCVSMCGDAHSKAVGYFLVPKSLSVNKETKLLVIGRSGFFDPRNYLYRAEDVRAFAKNLEELSDAVLNFMQKLKISGHSMLGALMYYNEQDS